MGDPTTSGRSSTLGPGKFNRPVTHGLMKVGSETSRGREDHEKISGVDTFRSCPVMGSVILHRQTHHRKAGRQWILKVMGQPGH